jgi:polysaccharide deacetylase family protein (PEP-CTERM system associated)
VIRLGETAQGGLRHVLSFDVEEHFQVAAFWSVARRREWDQLASRVERNTRKITDLLSEHSTKATFFVLGWVAERHPNLVKDLAQQGHEIASHGYGHELVHTQTPIQFREDVRRSKRILEDLIGRQVLGYRAPSFSITSQTEWAIPVLIEEGYRYDSSIYNRFRSTQGSTVTKVGTYQLETEAGTIWEVSPSTLNACGLQLPVAGGGYFRLFPYAASRMFLKNLENQGSQLVMYLHPWEFDPEQPRMDGSVVSKFRHYLNLKKTETRLQQLVKDFRFTSIREAIDAIDIACADKENLLGVGVAGGTHCLVEGKHNG